MSSILANLTWTEIERNSTLLVPVGSIEQHGPHLPLDTDTVIASAVAAGVAQQLCGNGDYTLVAPPLSYGSSGEHQDFPGTSSIGTEVLGLLIIELTRSVRRWAHRVVFINAHGGNAAALASAINKLRSEGHEACWAACATENFDLHAGRTETSLMLYLSPEQVRFGQAEAGNTGKLNDLLPLMREEGVKAVSANGVLGDPAGASATEGSQLLKQMVWNISTALLRKGKPFIDKYGAAR